MKIKNGLLTLTAASVLAFGTAFAADDATDRPAEPFNQPGASSTDQPETAETRELGESATEQSTAEVESESSMSEPAAGGGMAGGASEPVQQDPSASAGAGQAGGMSQQLDQETVKELQQALNDKGHDVGSVDGMMVV